MQPKIGVTMQTDLLGPRRTSQDGEMRGLQRIRSALSPLPCLLALPTSFRSNTSQVSQTDPRHPHLAFSYLPFHRSRLHYHRLPALQGTRMSTSSCLAIFETPHTLASAIELRTPGPALLRLFMARMRSSLRFLPRL